MPSQNSLIPFDVAAEVTTVFASSSGSNKIPSSCLQNSFASSNVLKSEAK